MYTNPLKSWILTGNTIWDFNMFSGTFFSVVHKMFHLDMSSLWETAVFSYKFQVSGKKSGRHLGLMVHLNSVLTNCMLTHVQYNKCWFVSMAWPPQFYCPHLFSAELTVARVRLSFRAGDQTHSFPNLSEINILLRHIQISQIPKVLYKSIPEFQH